jgi:large subunit ribosomal protein L1
MASTRPCLAQLSRLCISAAPRPKIQTPLGLLQPITQLRFATGKKVKESNENKYAIKKRAAKALEKRKRKPRTSFIQYDLRDADQFALLDAMRFVLHHIRFEVLLSNNNIAIFVQRKLANQQPQ